MRERLQGGGGLVKLAQIVQLVLAAAVAFGGGCTLVDSSAYQLGVSDAVTVNHVPPSHSKCLCFRAVRPQLISPGASSLCLSAGPSDRLTFLFFSPCASQIVRYSIFCIFTFTLRAQDLLALES